MGASTDQPPVGRPALIDVSEELAERVPATEPTAEDLGDLTREQLDERARTASVVEPEKLPNKQAVIDAIETAETQPSDEGTNTNPED
jgi:hypothetical protein